MQLTRRGFLVSGIATMALPAWPAAAGTVGIGGAAFGSTWRMALPDETSSEAARDVVATVVSEINQAMSPYLATSELSLFNRSGELDWQACSSPLADVASNALAMSQLTGGAFDPTVGPLVNRFGFGPIHGGMARPEDLFVDTNRLRKSAPGLTLDLCGIAKGYALDRIVGALPSAGISAALVELGGEVRPLGRHPDGRDWHVGIERPDAEPGVVAHIVAPGRLALATSGTGRQHIGTGRGGVSHLIEPRTGRPVDAAPVSVSILADSGMRADALATAIIVMGMERGAAFAEDHSIAAFLIRFDNGDSHAIMTAGFDRHVIA